MTDRIFTYYRVSTEMQKEKMSYKTQKEVVERFLKGKDIEIVHEFRDEAFSGKDFSRDGWDELMSMLEAVDGIAIYDMSRFSRSLRGGATEMWHILNDLHKKIYVATTGAVLDEKSQSSLEEQLTTLVMLYAAEKQRTAQNRAISDGMKRAHAERGHWGRSKKNVDWAEFDKLRNKGVSVQSIAKIFTMSRKTLNTRIAERNG
jgi:DNA invertase Pin-like site-specific DNA recombinase